MADANEQASMCTARIQADFAEATAASDRVTGMHEAMQAPELLTVCPAATIDITAMLATAGVPIAAEPQSPPAKRRASIFSALRRQLSLLLGPRDTGVSP